ncbi:C39 family peptidase [Marinobacterium stanieri]|uniref:C39 family peptidase n=1 Tax=Marinobacterium stanieri TaxID=49186 RepID=UPI0002558BEE|nr:cysteine peptidase family C39 domain-containing protein [Marinobacterium stanieri]
MKLRILQLYFLIIIFSFQSTPVLGEDSVFVNSFNLHGSIPVKSWKSLRDARVVKQDLDHSCGAASVATILNAQYSHRVSEADILDAMDKHDMRASFSDMALAVEKLGYRGVGYALSFEQLSKLKVPVIVYTRHRKDDHFSVLRGISADTVWLADPSLGNRTYSRHQFLKIWETRGDARLKGKILAILPKREGQGDDGGFFIEQPRRQSHGAIMQQVFRASP